MADWTATVAGVRATPLDPAPGLARLREVVETVEAATERREAVRLVSALLASPDAVRELAVAWRRDYSGLMALLMRLGGVRGLAARTLTLERVLRDAAERQRRLEVDARYQLALGAASAGTVAEDLQRCLGGHPLPEDLRCPPGWELSPTSLSRIRMDPDTEETEEIVVAHRPLVVEGRLRDVEDGAVHLVLGWPGAQGGWHTQVVPRFQVSDAREIVALSQQDAPITSNTASQIVTYLADFESMNAETIPQSRVSDHMGWHGTDDDLYFLWGRTVLRPGGADSGPAAADDVPALWRPGQVQLLTPDTGLRGLAEGFRVAGTWEGWRELVLTALPFPRVMLVLYAAVVPPLMRFLPSLPNFIVDLSGETSHGKTTTVCLAASLWGNPDERGRGLIYTWDVTRVFVEQAGAMLDYLPFFLDDTKRARKPEEVGKTLFDFASGIGRGRGLPGGVQKVTRAHGVMLSSGEAPATSFTNDGGTRARTICLWGSPFEGTGPATARAVERVRVLMLQHHGHAGPRLVRHLLDRADVRAGLGAAYQGHLARWLPRTHGRPVAGRAVHYLAALELARQLFHDVLDLPHPPRDPLADAWEAVAAGAADADRATEALREVLSWAAGQQHRFYGRIEHEPNNDQPPAAGWLGAWAQRDDWKTLALLPNELKGFLEKQGYDTEAVLRSWRDRSWLHTEEGHLTRKVLVGARKARCFVVKRETVDLVAGPE